MILHGGFMHLFMNMLVLSMLGFACEYYLGVIKYSILIVIGAVGGNIFSAVF
jgi:rhomboid protease GluP